MSSGKAYTYIEEPSRPIPVAHAGEVVVAGGGVSGVCAAVAAARNGARTLLIERYGFCGGNATMFLPLLSFLDQRGNEVIKGIGKEIVERIIALGGCPGHGRDPLHVSYAPIDPEVTKRVIMEKLEEAGVDTVPELAQRNPENLHKAMVNINADKKLVRKLPTQSQVAAWVAQAKELPRAITY